LINHGGADKALCVYCEEHYPNWESKLGRKLAYGSFGENITVRGLLESDISIGDIYQLGEAVVQVTQPRQPCYKLAKKHDVTDLPMQVQDTGFTGYYFRVLEEGTLPVQPKLMLIAKHAAGVTIAYANQIKYNNKSSAEAIKRILAVAELSSSWRESFERRLAELGK
jgi:MOSC domain-containing protein YiiM